MKSNCEWCHRGDRECDILIYGDNKVMVICKGCLTSLRNFLEEVDVNESET